MNDAEELAAAGAGSIRPGPTAGAVAAADSVLKLGAGSSRSPSVTSEVAARGLREDVFKAYLDQQMAVSGWQQEQMGPAAT
jgi:hypothetical protein